MNNSEEEKIQNNLNEIVKILSKYNCTVLNQDAKYKDFLCRVSFTRITRDENNILIS